MFSRADEGPMFMATIRNASDETWINLIFEVEILRKNAPSFFFEMDNISRFEPKENLGEVRYVLYKAVSIYEKRFSEF